MDGYGHNRIQYSWSLAPKLGGSAMNAASKTNTAQRFSCVLGMLSSLEVQVLRPT